MALPCFEKAGYNEATEAYKALVKAGMNEKQAGLQVVEQFHKQLHGELNTLKRKAKVRPDVYEAPDTAKKVKGIVDEYSKIAAEQVKPKKENVEALIIKKTAPTVEQQNIKAELDKATEDLATAKEAFDRKRKELDKGLKADQEDLFGDRKSKDPTALFDERASKEARDAAIKPFKDRWMKAQKEVERVQNQLDALDGKETQHIEIDFENGIPKDASKELKQKVSDFFDGLKIGKDKLLALPIPPELWNGFVEVVKQAALGSITLAEAVAEGVKYLTDKGVTPDKIKAAEDHLAKVITVKQQTRSLPRLTGTAATIAEQKFENALNYKEPDKPSFWSNTKELFKNFSFYIDNKHRYITKLHHDIEAYYQKKVGNLSLGRIFEQDARGLGLFKVQQFVDSTLKGLKKSQLNDFHTYVFARRIIDRYEQMKKDAGVPGNLPALPGGTAAKESRGTGNITIEEAVHIIHKLNSNLGQDAMNDFVTRADAMQDAMDENMQLLVSSGVLSKEAYETIKSQNDFYAPFNVVQQISRQEGGARPAVAANVVQRIKGISFKEGDYKVVDIETLQQAYADGKITKNEFYETSAIVLDNLKQQGAITDVEFAEEMGKLSDAGFSVTNIFDKAANIIFDSNRIAHRNRLMNRLTKIADIDKDGLFVKKVDGFELRYDKNGNATSIPKRLMDIKTEPGFGAIGYRENGKQMFLAINVKAANTINGLDRVELAGWMKGMNVLNKIFRTAVITLSAPFQAANFVIDFFRNAAMNKYGLLAGKNIGDSFANAVFFIPQYIEAIISSGKANIIGVKDGLYLEFMQSKAFSKGLFDDPFQTGGRKLNVQPKSTFDHIKFGGLDKLFKLLEGIGTTLEQSHKIVSVARGLDVEAGRRIGIARWKNIISKAKTPADMVAALDSIVYETQNYAGSPNFQATHGGMKVLSVFLQFFSARIKGEITDYRRMVTLFGGNAEGMKLSTGERARLLGQFAAKLMPIVLMALINNKYDEDEKHFDSNSAHDRDNHVMIPAGTFEYENENGETETLRDYVKIPVRGLDASMNVMANSFVKYMKSKDKETLQKGVIKTFANASPLNISGDTNTELMESAFPGNATSAIKWYLELSMNRNTFRHKELVYDNGWRGLLKQYNEGLIKPYEVTSWNTPPWAIKMSQYMFDEWGYSFTPIHIDHFENTMLGNPSGNLEGNFISKRFLRSHSKYPKKYDK